jgi:hypothetical protein
VPPTDATERSGPVSVMAEAPSRTLEEQQASDVGLTVRAPGSVFWHRDHLALPLALWDQRMVRTLWHSGARGASARARAQQTTNPNSGATRGIGKVSTTTRQNQRRGVPDSHELSILICHFGSRDGEATTAVHHRSPRRHQAPISGYWTNELHSQLGGSVGRSRRDRRLDGRAQREIGQTSGDAAFHEARRVGNPAGGGDGDSGRSLVCLGRADGSKPLAPRRTGDKACRSG